MRRRTSIVTAAATAVVIGLGATTIAPNIVASETNSDPRSGEATAGENTTTANTITNTAEVARGDLASERDFKATVSFGDSWTVASGSSGTITEHHPAGTIVRPGEVLVRVDDKPIHLAKGEMPMYRELREVDTGGKDENGNRLKLQTGLDVEQLQAFLIDAGFDDKGRLEADGEFGAGTERAVKAWQKSVGLTVTGRVDDGQLVFEKEPVRIAEASRVGADFAGLEVNNAEPSVLVDTSTRDRSALPVDSTVEIALVGGGELQGTVTAQKQVTGGDGSTVWRTRISARGPLPGDASTATVTVTEVAAENVLHVPVGALLALAEGGFAVEIPNVNQAIDDGGPTAATRLVRVQVGSVLEGRAEVSGEVTEGDQVVIPA